MGKIKLFLLSLIFCVSASAQYTNWLNVKNAPFSCSGNGIADDYAGLQAALDSAVKVNATVYIPQGTYSISAPLIVYRWTGSAYAQAYINIVGDDEMLSEGISVIKPTFKNGFALGLHLNKGTTVTGLTIEGLYNMDGISTDSLYKSDRTVIIDGTCRDSRYSPYAGIVVDPFRGITPPDGGYPTLTSYYRGADNNSGSTGLIFNDINLRGFTVGAIISPNGVTLNAELLTFEDIYLKNCKTGFVGCQSQEKGNRLINWAVYGKVRTAFGWAMYGQVQPGHYILDGIYCGYGVVDMLFRSSVSYFPLYVNNAIGDKVGRIGEWTTTMNDALVNSTFDFLWYDTTGNSSFLSPQLFGSSGLTLMNTHFRYAGHPTTPVMFATNLSEAYNFGTDSGFAHAILGSSRNSNAGWLYNYGFSTTLTATDTLHWFNSSGVRTAVIGDATPPTVGTPIVITNSGSDTYVGMAVVSAVSSGVSFTIKNISPVAVYGTIYRYSTYNSSTIANWKPNNINGNANVYDTTIVNQGVDTTIYLRIFKNLQRFP